VVTAKISPQSSKKAATALKEDSIGLAAVDATLDENKALASE
jgi:hypothetical protein